MWALDEKSGKNEEMESARGLHHAPHEFANGAYFREFQDKKTY